MGTPLACIVVPGPWALGLIQMNGVEFTADSPSQLDAIPAALDARLGPPETSISGLWWEKNK